MNTSNKKPRYWVVVADQAKVNFYSQEQKKHHLQKEFSMQNSAAQKKTSELLADRGGRSFDSKGMGRHTLSKHVDPKEHEAQLFAKTISDRLARLKPEMSGYALIAAPHFLGTLRKAMDGAGCPLPDIAIDKDYSDRDAAAIEKLLRQNGAGH